MPTRKKLRKGDRSWHVVYVQGQCIHAECTEGQHQATRTLDKDTKVCVCEREGHGAPPLEELLYHVRGSQGGAGCLA
eukprot:scaffold38146_cov20-Tisochrysis_lutea.AAC.1